MGRLKRSTRRRVGQLTGQNPAVRIRDLRFSLQFAKKTKVVRTLVGWGRGLSDHTRMCTLSLLKAYGDLTVTELQVGLGISQPAVSQHLRVLSEGGLVTHRPRVGWIYYSLTRDAARMAAGFLPDDLSGRDTRRAITDAEVVLPAILKERMDRVADGHGEKRARQLRKTVRYVSDHERGTLTKYQTRAIANRTRVLMLSLMNMYQGLTETELAAALNMSHAAVSEHLRILMSAGIVLIDKPAKAKSDMKDEAPEETPAPGKRRKRRWARYRVLPRLAGMLPQRILAPRLSDQAKA
jgi:DNA-binding transcriptional ArsR family regulator